MKPCSVAGCDRPRRARSPLCSMHDQRRHRNGDPMVKLRHRGVMDAPVAPASVRACWECGRLAAGGVCLRAHPGYDHEAAKEDGMVTDAHESPLPHLRLRLFVDAIRRNLSRHHA